MNLPEIRNHTSQFLDLQDLAACVRVSRDWYASFTPALYSCLNTWNYRNWSPPLPASCPSSSIPPGPSLDQRLHVLQRLTIHSGVTPTQQSLILNKCTRLTDLSVNLTETISVQTFALLTRIRDQNPRLQRVQLKFLANSVWTPIPKQLPPTLRTLGSRLTDLRLEELNLFPVWWQILDLLLQLRVLHLTKCVIPHPCVKQETINSTTTTTTTIAASSFPHSSSPSPSSWRDLPKFPYLYEMKIQASRAMEFEPVVFEDQLLFLFARCPRLETMIWDLDLWPREIESIHMLVVATLETMTAAVMGAFATLLQDQTWPRLCSLEFLQTVQFQRPNLIPDEQLARVIRSCPFSPGLRRLRMPRSNFGPVCWRALRQYHLETLEILDVSDCPGFSSRMCQETLAMFPRLRELSAGELEVSDVAKGVRQFSTATVPFRHIIAPQSWICSGLESLSVSLVSSTATSMDITAATTNTAAAVPSTSTRTNILRSLSYIKAMIKGGRKHKAKYGRQQDEIDFFVNQLVQLKNLKVLALCHRHHEDVSCSYRQIRAAGLDPRRLPRTDPRWDYRERTSPTFSKTQMPSHPFGRRLLEIWPRLESCTLGESFNGQQN
ncbi:hypothetical protein BGZ83_010331 [Gryganskiella cystojenkinii]|nr:hypothetical protein BGZ83_010331 [Gryganskiella cystojenkinii]